MAVTGKGLFYQPAPPPQMGGEREIVKWCEAQFTHIANVLREGGSQSLRLDVLNKKPARPIDGMLCFFAANVVSAGSGAGSYEYKGGAWVKL